MKASWRMTGRALLLGTVLPVACSSAEEMPFDTLLFQERTGVVFIAQNVFQYVVMDSLFEGRVVVDGAGCLRLGSADAATVVWPKGFTIHEIDGGMLVRSGTGREIGRIGDSFRLGGGEVQSLHAGIGVSATDRQRAGTHCPGRYWIVGDVP